jgi:protoheme ferro-lyase
VKKKYRSIEDSVEITNKIMKKYRIKKILYFTILNFIGLILISRIFQFLVQPLKTNNSWINEEKVKNFYDPKQLLIWLLISVIMGVFWERRKQKK